MDRSLSLNQLMDSRSFPWLGVAMDMCTQVLHRFGSISLDIHPGGELLDYLPALHSAF